MYASKLVFSQVIDHLPIHTFRRCVVRYQGNRYVKSFSCLDQYFCMAFAQLTYRESLLALEACLRAQKDKLYHMGIRGGVSKSTLADANEARDWRIYADFAQSLIRIARPLYADEELGLDLDKLRKLGLATARLAFLPCLAEALLILAVSGPLLGLPHEPASLSTS